MKILSYILGGLFLLFAVVQINDPDGATWVLAYGFISVIALAYAWKNKLYLPILIPAVALYGFFTVFLWPGNMAEWWYAEEANASSSMKMPFIEEGREAIGLLICTLVLVFYMILAIRKRKSKIAVF